MNSLIKTTLLNEYKQRIYVWLPKDHNSDFNILVDACWVKAVYISSKVSVILLFDAVFAKYIYIYTLVKFNLYLYE